MTQCSASYLSAGLAESQKPKTQHTQEWKNSVQILNHILILRVLYHFANTFHQIIIFCDKKRVMRVANLRGIFRARLAKTRMTFDLPRSSFQYHLQLPDILISKCSPAKLFYYFLLKTFSSAHLWCMRPAGIFDGLRKLQHFLSKSTQSCQRMVEQFAASYGKWKLLQSVSFLPGGWIIWKAEITLLQI